ncbi:MAG: polymerase subunit beta [Verrucomicrobiota bacterium]|jgi:DNA polymerase-3 subunit beta
MRFSVAKEKLLAGLQTVQNVVSSRTTLPVLSNVRIQANDGHLRFTTTDLDVGISCQVEAQSEKTGGTTLPVKRLSSIVRELTSGEVQVEVDSKNIASIRCGQTFFKIHGLPEDEFPALPHFENAKLFTLKQADLKDALRKTSYAISTDETRYVLNGILFSFKDNRLTMVATDGRRLALVDVEVEFPQSDEVEIIVPTKCVNELARLVENEGELKMHVSQNQVAFDIGSTRLVSKLVEGNYPNYRQVIPSEMRERVTLERQLFLAAVHRVSLLASEKSNSVKLVFTKNNLEIAANTPDVGEGRESIPVVYKGADISIAFNPEYLMAPLRALPDDEVFLDLIDEMSPGVIKIQSPFLYVLMPMRIS